MRYARCREIAGSFIYQDRHATPLADQATAALASLTGHPSAESA